ncbi:site-specific integrase [Blautia coccoides]|uniref:site-specific integrase n=1 Tax=Blautia producta TaxID=33035 RepID=UPI00214A0A62|nr:site-specific integrase [Blautia coccoides]MCR1989763.1 site-specific integrase [Blautia coccoides]
MPSGKKIEKPDINPKLTYGEIVSWEFRPSITPQRDKYCFRFKLTFENGHIEPMQVGGFTTKAEAHNVKELTIAALHKREYVPFPKITLKEFYDYWLYYYMIDVRKIAYPTLINYRNIIYNYIIPKLGADEKMINIDRSKIIEALQTLKSDSIFSTGKTVIKTSFKIAKEKHLIYSNASAGAIRTVKNERMRQQEEKKKEQGDDFKPPEQRPVYSAEQVSIILNTAKERTPNIFIPLLFTITAGLRISEAVGVKFKDIDFGKKELHLSHQVGRSIDDSGLEENELYCQELDPKSENGIRVIPLADFVIDEIVLARRRYDALKIAVPNFKDYDYITFQMSGKPFVRNYVYPQYNELLEYCKIPKIEWHDLRHTYSTLLAQYGISMKAVSVCMGHASKEFTQAVYVTSSKVVYDAVEEITPFMMEVLPGPKKRHEIEIDDNYLLEVLPETAYN